MDIEWGNKVINIYKADSFMTQKSSTLYEMDTNAFRLALKDLEDDEEGITHDDTHSHNAEYTVAGITYAQKLEIINGYKVKFEDGQYTVKLTGSNNNLFDVDAGILVKNQVSIIGTNSAGLIMVVSGSGVTEQDKLDISDRIWDELGVDHETVGTMGKLQKDAGSGGVDITALVNAIWDELVTSHSVDSSFGKYIQEIKAKTDTINWNQVELMWDALGGKREIVNNQEIFYKLDNTTEVMRFNLFNKNGQPAETNVYKRERV